jgi:hypothetical protein
VGIEDLATQRGDPALLDHLALLHHDRPIHGAERALNDQVEGAGLLQILVDPRRLVGAVAEGETGHVVAHARSGVEGAGRDHDRGLPIDGDRDVIGSLAAVRSDVVRDARAPVDRAGDGVERRGGGDGPSAAVRVALEHGFRPGGRGCGENRHSDRIGESSVHFLSSFLFNLE